MGLYYQELLKMEYPMKYDIHEFERLHFLCEQIEKAGLCFAMGHNEEISPKEKYAALIFKKDRETLAEGLSNESFIAALSIAYRNYQRSNDELTTENNLAD